MSAPARAQRAGSSTRARGTAPTPRGRGASTQPYNTSPRGRGRGRGGATNVNANAEGLLQGLRAGTLNKRGRGDGSSPSTRGSSVVPFRSVAARDRLEMAASSLTVGRPWLNTSPWNSILFPRSRASDESLQHWGTISILIATHGTRDVFSQGFHEPNDCKVPGGT